jgi:hypothetical protein
MRLSLLALSLFACGGGNGVNHIIDAPAASDDGSPSPDAPSPPKPVTVTITYNGAGQAGVSAIFTNADGSPVATLQTDATGTASQTLGSGGYVTVVDPFPSLPGFTDLDTLSDLYTWAGVKPGDHLELYESTTSGTSTTFTLETAIVANATTYDVSGLCAAGDGGFGSLTPPNGSGAVVPTGQVTFYGCTTADVYVAAYDSSNTLLATLWHPGLSVTANQTVDLSTSDHYATAIPATYTYTNVPSINVQVDYDMVGSNGSINALDQVGPVGSGSATVTVAQPVLPAGDVAFVDTTFTTPSNSHDVYAWSPAANTSYTLDASTAVLPDVTSAPAFDYATDQLSWTPGSGATPDAVLAEVDFEGDPAISSWSIVAPYADGVVQFPQLADLMPAMTDTMEIGQLSSAKVPGGYDAIRAFALAELDPTIVVGLGASGQALLQSYSSDQGDVARRRGKHRAHVLAKRHR